MAILTNKPIILPLHSKPDSSQYIANTTHRQGIILNKHGITRLNLSTFPISLAPRFIYSKLYRDHFNTRKGTAFINPYTYIGVSSGNSYLHVKGIISRFPAGLDTSDRTLQITRGYSSGNFILTFTYKLISDNIVIADRINGTDNLTLATISNSSAPFNFNIIIKFEGSVYKSFVNGVQNGPTNIVTTSSNPPGSFVNPGSASDVFLPYLHFEFIKFGDGILSDYECKVLTTYDKVLLPVPGKLPSLATLVTEPTEVSRRVSKILGMRGPTTVSQTVPIIKTIYGTTNPSNAYKFNGAGSSIQRGLLEYATVVSNGASSLVLKIADRRYVTHNIFEPIPQ
ncbi:MAG TPA: hypothetical protein V6C58_16900, partial [Allocoleopsis sp.]